MPIVGYFERKKVAKIKLIFFGALFITFGFYALLLKGWVGILVINLVLITFGEMFAFPFSNSFAMSRAPKGHEGRYMALYTMSFSLAHVMSSKTGMEIISRYNYTVNWIFMGTFAATAAFATIWLLKIVKSEND
jgi:MFS family permease